MAAITKSSVTPRERGTGKRTIVNKIFCFLVVVVFFGTIGGYLPLFFVNIDNQNDNNPLSSSLSSPLLSIKTVQEQLQQPSQRQKEQEEEEEEEEEGLSFPQSNKDHFRNPSLDNGKNVYIYHHTLRSSSGKEGAVILNMLMAHAYAYHNGFIYGGSCGEGNDVGRDPENSLIEAVGLQDYLQFACPRDLATTDRKKVIPSNSYVHDGTRIFTPEYVEKLKTAVNIKKNISPHQQERDANSKINTIVVHVSRGKKFTPCRRAVHNGYEPYLPNKHYQVSEAVLCCVFRVKKCISMCEVKVNIILLFLFTKMLINKYMKPESDGYENKVIIYSQSTSYESLDEFKERGYELHIDEPIDDVWKTIMTVANVFIMSRSSFSFVPAMLVNNDASNSTKVVYTPFWDEPIRGWDIVRKDIQTKSDMELERLKSTCPAKKTIRGTKK